MREHLAHLAARLMAVDGIEDYGLAKRKAARQAGVSDTRQLPNNQEIDAALHQYREVNQPDHPAYLNELRVVALAAMDELARFDPYLTGPALSGEAGKYAGIHLQLFTDNIKGVEHYVLDAGINYRSGKTQFYAGGLALDAPTISYAREGIEIRLILLSRRELRFRLKTSLEGKPINRAGRAQVAALSAGK